MRVQYSVYPIGVTPELGFKFEIIQPAGKQLETARLRARYLADNRIWFDYGVRQVAIVDATEAELENLAESHSYHDIRHDDCLCCCK